jgi:hypothetical protein
MRAIYQCGSWVSQTLTTATGGALTDLGGGRVFPQIHPWTFAPAASGLCSFTNAGNEDTRPLLRLNGSLSDPSVVLTRACVYSVRKLARKRSPGLSERRPFRPLGAR